MLRYLKLYFNFLRFSFSKALEFRIDFSFRIIMDVAYYTVAFAFFKVIYLHTPSLVGWNESQIYVFMCGYFLMDSLHMAIFSANMWWLPIYVNRGDLDYYLIRPVSPIFFLSFREFSASSFMNVLMATGLLIWSLFNYVNQGAVLEWANLLTFLFLLFCGLIIHWLVYLTLVIPVFWLHSNRGLGDLFFGLTAFMERPIYVFKGWALRIFLTVIPLGLVASFPAKVFFDGPSLDSFAHILVVLFGYSIFVKWFWNLGLKNYASASS